MQIKWKINTTETSKAPQRDMNVIPMNSYQYEGYKQMLGALCLLEMGFETLKPHLKRIGAWRRARSAQGLLRKSADMIIDHMPEDKAKRFQNDFHFLTAKVCYKSVTHDHEIDYDVFNCKAVDTLCMETINDRCLLCEKCISEAKKCPVRGALKALVPADIMQPASGMCEFNGVDLAQYMHKEARR